MVTKYNSGQLNDLARHRVRRGIEQLIMAGQCQPGDRLRQQELAQRFGVAQSVVRESLLELQFTGLVQSVDRIGVFVSELDARQLLDAYEVREMFEGVAARRCCEYASRADLAALRQLADETLARARAGDMHRTGAHDRQFHAYTLRISRNEMIIRLTESYRVLGMAVTAERDSDVVHQEHLAIVDAIEANQPDEAEHRARQHVRAARQNIARMIERNGFKPKWVVDDPQPEPSK